MLTASSLLESTVLCLLEESAHAKGPEEYATKFMNVV
jgi:hypothetical protein